MAQYEYSSQQFVEQTNRRIIQDLCQPLQLSNDVLIKIKQLFLKEIKMGLKKHIKHESMVKCYLTYVQKLPTGCEKGRCLVLDLAGSNFIITLITLNGQMNYKIQDQKYNIPEHFLTGSGKKLFDYVAKCLGDFVQNLSLHREKLPLSFTFGFPIKQYGLHRGDLVSWSKNINLPDVVGCNVVELLREAIERRKEINISTIVLMNDTTTILISCAFKSRFCKIGVIVDDGCNASYVEQVKNITKFADNQSVPTLPYMIINTEWASFGDNGSLEFIQTQWDEQINKLLPTKDRRTFEKMTAGLYLGPLVREILLDAIRSGALFQGVITSALEEPNSFKTSFIFDIENEKKDQYFIIREILSTLGYENATTEDCANVRYICEMVLQRSAYLIAATVSCLIDRVGDPFLTVGIDGNIFRCSPQFCTDFWEKLKDLVRPEHKFDLFISETGSVCGAALVAIIAEKFEKLKAKHKTKMNGFNVGTTSIAATKKNLRQSFNERKTPKFLKVKCCGKRRY